MSHPLIFRRRRIICPEDIVVTVEGKLQHVLEVISDIHTHIYSQQIIPDPSFSETLAVL
jgi:hypothetical protein